MCADIFGPRFDINLVQRGVEDTNTYYGGLDKEVIYKRIIYRGNTGGFHIEVIQEDYIER